VPRSVPLIWSAIALTTLTLVGGAWWAVTGGGTTELPPPETVQKSEPAAPAHDANSGTRTAAESEEIVLQAEKEGHRARGRTYEALVGTDGNLCNLSAGGAELLRPGVDSSRGIYLHNDQGLVPLTEAHTPAGNLIEARGYHATLRFEFGPDSITCTAENKTDKGMALFIVFAPAVLAVRDGSGDWQKLPTFLSPAEPPDKKWETTAWFTAGGQRLTITGGSRVWGPWSAEGLQVWESSLMPRETRRVILQIGVASPEETRAVADLTGPSSQTSQPR